jgi:hypothetical protein
MAEDMRLVRESEVSSVTHISLSQSLAEDPYLCTYNEPGFTFLEHMNNIRKNSLIISAGFRRTSHLGTSNNIDVI